MYFCEFASHVTKEELPASEELKLLYCALRALTKPSIGMPLVRAVFELKFLQLLGIAPELHHCVKCGKTEGLCGFSAAADGMVCKECSTVSDVVAVSESALYTIQYIMSAPIGKLYTFTVSDEVLRQLQLCIKRFLRMHIDYEMKAVELLEELK